MVTKVKKTKSVLETVSDSNHALKDLWSLLNEDTGVGVGQPIVVLKATAKRMPRHHRMPQIDQWPKKEIAKRTNPFR